MNLENMEVVNTRISDAVAAGRLDPDQIPANLEDIKALQPKQKKAFFEAVYPGAVTEEIAAMLQAGTQLPEEDLQLLSLMPISQINVLPPILQSEVMTYINTSDEVQSALDKLQDTLDNVIDTICQEAKISRDEYSILMHALLQHLDTNNYQLSNNTDIKELAKLLTGLKKTNLPTITTDIFSKNYVAMWNGDPTNDLMVMSTTKMEKDELSGRATFTKNGHTITIKGDTDMIGAVGVSAKKLLDAACAIMTNSNYSRASTVNPTATINLMDYWRAQKLHVDPLPMDSDEEQRKEQSRVAENIKKLKKGIKRDLENLKRLEWEGHGTGRHRGDYAKYSYISSYQVKGTTLYVTFDYAIANAFLQSHYMMQWSPILLLHDNPNSYVIGRKLLYHHSMDKNAAAATDNTLAVSSLLAMAPDIQSIEELQAKGRRDWKKQIKEKLELALNKNVTIAPVLTRWEYRHPVTYTTYTPETASDLSWKEYYKLMVDFVMVEEPDQAARRAAREAEKAASQEPSTKQLGRPRKNNAK